MDNHLVVVASAGGMWELASLVSEHDVSGIVGGNENISFLLNCNDIFSFLRDLGSAYACPAYGINVPPIKVNRSDRFIFDPTWGSACAGPAYV